VIPEGEASWNSHDVVVIETLFSVYKSIDVDSVGAGPGHFENCHSLGFTINSEAGKNCYTDLIHCGPPPSNVPFQALLKLLIEEENMLSPPLLTEILSPSLTVPKS